MQRIVFLALFLSITAAACLKTERDNTCPYGPSTRVAPQTEQDALELYLDTNGIPATKHPSGFYYDVVTPGSFTDTVALCSQILINYKGQLVNDTIFDQRTSQIFVLGSLIDGWKQGIPLIRKNGEINLYIPPSLGYGTQDVKDNAGRVVIPANSILRFNVKLLDYTVEN